MIGLWVRSPPRAAGALLPAAPPYAIRLSTGFVALPDAVEEEAGQPSGVPVGDGDDGVEESRGERRRSTVTPVRYRLKG